MLVGEVEGVRHLAPEGDGPLEAELPLPDDLVEPAGACLPAPVVIQPALQPLLPNARVSEVRQIARTSEGLLAKVKLLMALVTAVVLVSAGSSVAGTMSTTVLERGKEIGLMKAMGGTRWEVMLIFCGEAALLGILGGLAGYLFGSAIAQFITRTVFSASAEFIPWFAGISLGVSLFLALLGSVGPMISVFKLDPVRSLRGE